MLCLVGSIAMSVFVLGAAIVGAIDDTSGLIEKAGCGNNGQGNGGGGGQQYPRYRKFMDGTSAFAGFRLLDP
jgi:hypothetical protein